MILMSFWKPLLLLLIFLPWAWIVSRIYDKHAARFHLARRQWNNFHLIMGIAAIVVGLAAGLPLANQGGFFVGFAGMLLVLVADIIIYAVIANRDERVPDDFKIKLDIVKKLADRKSERAAAKQLATVSLQLRSADGSTLAPPDQDSPEFQIRAAAEELYSRGLSARANRIEVGPTGKENIYGVVFHVDGVPVADKTMPAQDALRIMDFWKLAAGLDVSDRRRKQQAVVSISSDGHSRDMRVTSMGSKSGMKVTMLIDPAAAVDRVVDDLGLLDGQREALEQIMHDEDRGVVLISSPTHGGRTSSLYAVVRQHDAYTQNIQTLEFDSQMGIEGVRLNLFDPAAEGGEFATTLRSILRRDPDVVGVGDVPDAATAQEAAQAETTRTRIYLAMRADGALAALMTYVKASGNPASAAASLRGVTGQRLVRKLCTNCRVAYTPSPEMLKKLGLPEGRVKQLFKKGGQVLIKNKPEICPVCDGGGYYGQVGVFEVYPLGAEEREQIAASNWSGLQQVLRKAQRPAIQQVAIRKAVDGTTSVEEIMRAAMPAKRTESSKPPAA